MIPYFDKAIALCRRAGFRDILLWGDTDFALTKAFDRWTDAGVRFVFGYDATRTMVPLVVPLANTGEPLFLKNRSGNRPSHEGVIPYSDKAIALCRRAGFRDILLRCTGSAHP